MQFGNKTVFGMIKSIRTILTPLLIISYASGFSIIEFPKGKPRIWFTLFYMLLFWSIYYLLLKSIIIQYSLRYGHRNEYFVLMGIMGDILITLLSIVFGLYHDKKLRNCLRKLDIVDNTLLNMGTKINYDKLHKKTMCLVLVWFLINILLSYGTAYGMKIAEKYNVLIATYVIFIRNYCSYINIINDFIMAIIFEYIGLKFDEINQHLSDLTRDNKRRAKQKKFLNILMHEPRSSQASSDEWMTWIVIHLHSELRKICYEIDSIFGVQMTCKMGCNFCWFALDLRGLFAVIFLNNYYFASSKKLYAAIILILWLLQNVWKLFFINYICEVVGIKANTTGNLMKEMSYSTCDIKVRENISVFLLQITQAPVRFYGIGLFQFGYKFLYGFSSSITTVVVLLIQAVVNKQTF